ncbi:MAG: SEC-C domain-containing protein [Planctomycetes bacterium]|nr:SEC-C domain-containing protein [Planctomycetota bacterium]
MAKQNLLGRMARKLFGSRNERLVKRLTAGLSVVDEFESTLSTHSDEALMAQTDKLRARIDGGEDVEDVVPEAFATLREASRRAQRHRHFRCQLVGGKVLYQGHVAEMRTGEGKTIVCHLAAYMRVLQGEKVHIVTVNDYLVKRDSDFARPIFELLGLTVGCVQAQVDPGGREGIRKAAYACNLTYGTNSEFGFDYLRDNMKPRRQDQVQGSLDYAIIDEVDSILIDEARTPLIISGPAHDDPQRYKWADNLARLLVRKQAAAIKEMAARIKEWGDHPPEVHTSHPKFEGALPRFNVDPGMLTEEEAESLSFMQYYVVQRERKSCHLTHDGVAAAQDEAQIGSFYVGTNMDRPHLIEQSLRAHVVYERDKEYVVQDRQVIIVDEFTGRLMHGRQWSDGLHQAVEAKENVPIKEETQTLATITIQNYFKLYTHLAGMTGTALTEAEEFSKIYKLDVVAIPTNRPVNRLDHNDKIYRNVEQKYQAIVEEIHEVRRRGRPNDPFLLADVLNALRPILEASPDSVDKLAKLDDALKRFHNAEEGDEQVIACMMEAYDECMGEMAVGRPILVGTTSVENSEKLSKLLERTYGIEHEVLNAKNHAREAEIVVKAGHQTIPTRGADKTPLGNVTVATNMAGRGTDIKLGAAVVYATCKVPAANGSDSAGGDGAALAAGSGGVPDSVASLDVNSHALYPPGTTKCCIHCEEYDPKTNCSHCYKPKLDPRFPALGRTVCTLNTPCGLHIVGTERHEARRIDNQLRGRAGRQGDPGSSRFFLSLEDDLLKLFMPDWMLKMMEKLGFGDGASLEDKRLSKGIERAQRKVEERNFATRKHLLEWDEPMDYQRKQFYSARQRILDDRDLRALVFEILDESIVDAVQRYLATDYQADCVVNWCRSNLDLAIDATQVDDDELETVHQNIRRRGQDEAREQIHTTLGEYIDPDAPSAEWDMGGLLSWAQRAFKVSMTQNQLRKMDPADIEEALVAAAENYYAAVDLSGVQIYLDPEYPRRSLGEWLRNQFEVEFEVDSLVDVTAAEVIDRIKELVRAAYVRREISYPVEVCIERAYGEGATDSAYTAEAVVKWANGKFKLGWTADHVQGRSPQDVQAELLRINEEFLVEDRFDREIDQAMLTGNAEEFVEWARQRCGRAWDQRVFDELADDRREAVRRMGREVFRWELGRLEHAVLVHIYDQAWKDHLLEMDRLKHAIMQRPLGGDQTHPQSQYAIEGREFFDQMWMRIRDRVTAMIFKVRMNISPSGGGQVRAPAQISLQHADATGGGFAGAVADQSAAMKAQGQEAKVETIRRDKPKIGRNEPCPCGSGKKYKACHGRSA